MFRSHFKVEWAKFLPIHKPMHKGHLSKWYQSVHSIASTSCRHLCLQISSLLGIFPFPACIWICLGRNLSIWLLEWRLTWWHITNPSVCMKDEFRSIRCKKKNARIPSFCSNIHIKDVSFSSCLAQTGSDESGESFYWAFQM